MKQDTRYNPRSCFETFPEVELPGTTASLGRAFHDEVLSLSHKRHLALTPIWNLVNDPTCNDADIKRVRRLRDELTVAVAEAFDMKGIDFRFGFYKDHAGRDRYTMHPEAAEQVYLALVSLNAKQAAEEEAVATSGTVGTFAKKGQKKLQVFENES